MGDRIDRAHPAALAWLGTPARLVTLQELAALAGIPLELVERDRDQFEDAFPVDINHPATKRFIAKHNPHTR